MKYKKGEIVEVWLESAQDWIKVEYNSPGVTGTHSFKTSPQGWIGAVEDKDMRPVSELDENNPNTTFKGRR